MEEHGAAAGALMDEVQRTLIDNPHVALIGSPGAMTVAAARGGEPLSSAAYHGLTDEARSEIDGHVREAARKVFETQRRVHGIERKAREEVAEFHREVTNQVVTHRIESVKGDFRSVESVQEYLDAVGDDIVRHADEFLTAREGVPVVPGGGDLLGERFLQRYEVNPLIQNDPGSGAPVVIEGNPNLRNLLGRLEAQMRLGVMTTDFTQIAPGAAHRASGGYLLLKAEDLLSLPLVWPALKRMLRTGELKPADPASELGLVAVQSLEPEPIPADLKVVLLGEPRTFYALRMLDPEFEELFKVKVDFAPHMERNARSERGLARLVAAQCEERSFQPFDAAAVARIIEESSRIAGDQTKLTTRFRSIVDLIVEAAHENGDSGAVGRKSVEAAIELRETRNERPRRQLLELIERGVLTFHPSGRVSGQLHGLALVAAGDRAFGRPIRVMASAYAGSGGVVAVEREVDLSGPVHNKGFLVLTGYLGRRFAQTRPLAVSATVSFDQLYDEVEGDSASAAELYALLSAIGDIPLRQGIAVTGAINQDGAILPVGGVSEKVEGFFAACERVGLNGSQGVVIPTRNVDNLVVGEPVRSAVAEGRFSIFAIEHVEEGWPILCDLEAGTQDERGMYSEGSVHHAVMRRLESWSEVLKKTTNPPSEPE